MRALAAAFEGMRVEAHRDPSGGKSRDTKHLVSDNSRKLWYFFWKIKNGVIYLFGSGRKGCIEVRKWIVAVSVSPSQPTRDRPCDAGGVAEWVHITVYFHVDL